MKNKQGKPRDIKDIVKDLKEIVIKNPHPNETKVILDTLEYMEGYARKNKELIKTIKILADQADTKKNNLLNFHSANILQGMLIKSSTFSNETIVHQSIKLAKLMMGRLKDEEK